MTIDPGEDPSKRLSSVADEVTKVLFNFKPADVKSWDIISKIWPPLDEPIFITPDVFWVTTLLFSDWPINVISVIFKSVEFPVNPLILLNSVAVVFTPVNLFNSTAEDVTRVPFNFKPYEDPSWAWISTVDCDLSNTVVAVIFKLPPDPIKVTSVSEPVNAK